MVILRIQQSIPKNNGIPRKAWRFVSIGIKGKSVNTMLLEFNRFHYIMRIIESLLRLRIEVFTTNRSLGMSCGN